MPADALNISPSARLREGFCLCKYVKKLATGVRRLLESAVLKFLQSCERFA
jgi:hypothetical protein